MAVIYLAVWRDKRAKFQTEVEGGARARLSLQTSRLLAKKRIVSSESGHLGGRTKEAVMPRHAYCGRGGVMGHFLKS